MRRTRRPDWRPSIQISPRQRFEAPRLVCQTQGGNRASVIPLNRFSSLVNALSTARDRNCCCLCGGKSNVLVASSSAKLSLTRSKLPNVSSSLAALSRSPDSNSHWAARAIRRTLSSGTPTTSLMCRNCGTNESKWPFASSESRSRRTRLSSADASISRSSRYTSPACLANGVCCLTHITYWASVALASSSVRAKLRHAVAASRSLLMLKMSAFGSRIRLQQFANRLGPHTNKCQADQAPESRHLAAIGESTEALPAVHQHVGRRAN